MLNGVKTLPELINLKKSAFHFGKISPRPALRSAGIFLLRIYKSANNGYLTKDFPIRH